MNLISFVSSLQNFFKGECEHVVFGRRAQLLLSMLAVHVGWSRQAAPLEPAGVVAVASLQSLDRGRVACPVLARVVPVADPVLFDKLGNVCLVNIPMARHELLLIYRRSGVVLR
mmetsp:Transcript_26291/g.35102  ORF Transcript_26291/g.35102 Transcript_26291/m.35102 type:complete len:114 (-) Transcript_26291:2348-2689(-)